ncbi:hypothetical protein [Micromonospora sp. DT233]|uniref:hypothetical protein n=1 Tax=Micromonospora sp. DT233 TaxID=3393432 RepID=UPI003CEDA540
MNLPLLLRRMSELCADSRTVPLRSGGMHLHLGPRDQIHADTVLVEVDGRPRIPQITPLSFVPEGVGHQLTSNFVGRQGPDALDRMMYVPPTSSLGRLPDPAELARWADTLGLPVQLSAAQVAPGPTPPSGQHRVVPLDDAGRVTTHDRAHSIRVLPRTSLAAGAHANPVPEVAQLMAGRPYLSGRIVFGPDGAELGVPAGLVKSWFGDTLARVGRPLEQADVAAARSEGVASIVQVDGYVDLMRRVEGLPPESQALVTVADGVDSAVYLAHRDGAGVSFLDPGSAGAATFPGDPTRIELTVLPDTMRLGDRLDVLDAARYAAEPPATWPIRWPDEAAVTGGGTRPDREVVVVGTKESEKSLLDTAHAAIDKLDQPVIVLGVDTNWASPSPERVAAVRTLLEQYGWRNKVPVVVTRGRADAELLTVLDSYGAPLVHKVRTSSPSPATGGLSVNFGPSSSWRVRQPGDATVSGAKPAVNPQLTPALLADAGGRHRIAKYDRPPEQVATFLSTPLAARVGDGRFAQDLQGVKALRPLVEQIARRDPSFTAHEATLQLAELGKGEAVVSYLNAGDKRGDAIFDPLVRADGDTAQARETTVRTLLPHLASLAGGGMKDFASQGILTAIAGQLDGSMTPDQVRDSVWQFKDHLPTEGRLDWVRRIGELQDRLPVEHRAGLEEIGTIILRCPE